MLEYLGVAYKSFIFLATLRLHYIELFIKLCSFNYKLQATLTSR